MGVLKTIYITIFLNAFCIHTGESSPVADPEPGVNVEVNIKVNNGDGDGNKDVCPVNGKCNKDCGHWCYPSKNWPYICSTKNAPNGHGYGFCDGSSQSPIDISTGAVTPASGSLTFSSSYSSVISSIDIKNNGHAVGASLGGIVPARTISDGGLTEPYTLAQFHFHWGCENDRGSEHVVDGTRYAMELHLVHYKTSYGNLSNAIRYSDGLAVLGVFFDVGAENEDLKPITDNLHYVIGHKCDAEGCVATESSKNIAFGKALIDLIPTTRKFYRYQGSLTTPTCNEVVIWSVFSSPLTFSQKQIDDFRKLKDKECNKLCDNYRGIQPLNGRVVEKYTP